MTRSLSLAAVLAAGLALPALAEETPAKSAAEAKTAATPPAYRIVRTLGANKSCNRFMPGRRIVWRRRPLPQTQQTQKQ